MRDDCPGRDDRQVLARDLEDERPKRVERRKLVHPGPRTEVRPRVNQPRKHRIRIPKEVARPGIGERGSLAGSGPGDRRGHQTIIPPSMTTSMPVMYELSSEARNSTRFATSSASPRRPNSVLSISRGRARLRPRARWARFAYAGSGWARSS